MSFDWILQSGPIAMAVLAVLLVFSVVSWAIIFVKWRLISKAKASSTEFSELFSDLIRALLPSTHDTIELFA